MFWGVIITIAAATLFRNRRYILLVVCSGGVIYFFTTRSYRLLVYNYLIGVILAMTSVFLHTSTDRVISNTTQDVKLLSGIILTQEKITSYALQTNDATYLLFTDQPLVPGDIVNLQGKIIPAELPKLSRNQTPPITFFESGFSFPRRLAMKGYAGAVQAYGKRLIVSSKTPPGFVSSFRIYIKKLILDKFSDQQTTALLLGMLVGERSGFTREQYQSFIDSGLVHLVAVSGSNVLYVSLLIGALLFWLPFYPRIITIGVFVIIYGIICGADSSVLRAVGVGLCGLLATVVGRPFSSRRMMSILMMTMLLRNPLLLRYDLGFLLSFGATAGILLATDRHDLTSRFSGIYRKLFTHRIFPSLGASGGVLPVLIFFTGKVSLSGMLINLCIVPLVPLYLLIIIGSYLPGIGPLLSLSVIRTTHHLFDLATRLSTHGYFLVNNR